MSSMGSSDEGIPKTKPLEEILASDILDDLRGQDERLLDYLEFHIEGVVNHLLDKSDKSEYASICSNILSLDVPQLREVLFLDRRDLLLRIVNIFKEELSIRSCDNVTRVIRTFIELDLERFVEFVENRNFFVSLIPHLADSRVSEFLAHTITSQEKRRTSPFLQQLNKENFIRELFAAFYPKDNIPLNEVYLNELFTNICHLLIEIINLRTELRSSDPPLPLSPQSMYYCIEKQVPLLMEMMEKPNAGVEVDTIRAAVTLISRLLESFMKIRDNEETELPPIISELTLNCDIFKGILEIKGFDPERDNSSKPFGQKRILILELLCKMTECSSFFEECFINNDVVPILLEIFFGYYWNNFVHHTITKILILALENFSKNFERMLYFHYDLINYIISAIEGNNHDILKPKGIRRGYMGHIIILAKKIETSQYPEISSNEKWKIVLEQIKIESRGSSIPVPPRQSISDHLEILPDLSYENSLKNAERILNNVISLPEDFSEIEIDTKVVFKADEEDVPLPIVAKLKDKIPGYLPLKESDWNLNKSNTFFEFQFEDDFDKEMKRLTDFVVDGRYEKMVNDMNEYLKTGTDDDDSPQNPPISLQKAKYMPL